MPLPFGIKTPSKGTLIFSGIAGAISGIIYTSNKNAVESRMKLSQKISFLADRPCGVHEMPRKVTVYISAPPGDGLDKSRNWFREYVKPILVAGAVDYEVKEAKSPGQIETSIIEEIVKRRREAEATKELEENTESQQQQQQQQQNEPLKTNTNNNLFSSPDMKDMKKKEASELMSDGILAIGRNAYREVLSGLSKGCDASLVIAEEVKLEPGAEEIKTEETSLNNEETAQNTDPLLEITSTEMTSEINDQEVSESHFSLPPKFSPVMYIPHVNIIGWTNIPYRLYMWYADYKRIDEVGEYVVAAVLNQTRSIEQRDVDLGQQEKKYWLGDEEVEKKRKTDAPITIDERIFDKLETYISDSLP